MYWANLGEAGRRPVVIVSRAALSQGAYAVVVPFTTAQLHRRRALPNCVAFAQGAAGLPKECIAQAEAIAQVSLEALDAGAGPLGRTTPEELRALIRAIGWVIEAVCEPV